MRVTYQENFPLSLINENDHEFQPRLDCDEGILQALAKDIARNGQHNPVGLYQKGDYFQVVYARRQGNGSSHKATYPSSHSLIIHQTGGLDSPPQLCYTISILNTIY